MENSSRRRVTNRGVEENTLAILDATDIKDSKDNDDDRIAFLEAVRAASIVPEDGAPPTNKMFEAIFKILKSGKSVELIMASYQLLNELDKRSPRVHLSNSGASDSMGSSIPEIVVVEEAWSPFALGLDVASSEREAADKKIDKPFDSSGFQVLIQHLAEVVEETNPQALDTESLGYMLLFQYLVNVIEGDFLPRNNVYKGTSNWNFLRQSLLSMLLGSRRINYKGLIKDCLSIMSTMCHVHAGFSHDIKESEHAAAKPLKNSDTVVVIALLEVKKCTCIAVQKLLVMIMELDMSKKNADMQGSTTRADAVRTPAVEIILDEFTYNKDIISTFLQVFNEPKWKLEIVLQYFWKYIGKPSVRTRRSNGPTDDATLDGVLKCFSTSTSTKSLIKKISTDVAQLLLAHAFQAYLLLPSQQHPVEGIPDSKEAAGDISLVEICRSVISAFDSLKRTDEDMEILPFGKESLFTAATILSTKS